MVWTMIRKSVSDFILVIFQHKRERIYNNRKALKC